MSHTDDPVNGSPYRFVVTTRDNTCGHAFRTEAEYLAWLKTYKGVEFKGYGEGQTVVFCYRQHEKLISEERWNELRLPPDTRLINASIVLVKVDYDDVAHVVTEYRYENSGTTGDIPYYAARRKIAENCLHRDILDMSK